MPSYSYTSDVIVTSNSTNAITLAAGDKIYVAQGVTVSSSGSGSNAVIAPNGITATVAGDIFASYCGIITNTSDGNSKVTVKSTASIDADYGIYLNGTGNYIFNSGDVSGVYAVSFAAGNGYLQNSGNISGSFIGVQMYGAADTINTLVNSGSIGGTGYGVYCSTASDSITNTGVIGGTINLGSGNDLYNGSLGTAAGKVFGGYGDDRITGGSTDDYIAGGPGTDILTGNGGSDTFLFAEHGTAAHNDSVIDFQHGTDLVALDHSYFTRFASGALDPAFLRFGNASVDANDYLIYNSSGQLLYDIDANGTVRTPFVIATLAGHPTLTASDFIVL